MEEKKSPTPEEPRKLPVFWNVMECAADDVASRNEGEFAIILILPWPFRSSLDVVRNGVLKGGEHHPFVGSLSRSQQGEQDVRRRWRPHC